MTDEEANELSMCGYGCYVIGGPWITVNPDCPYCNSNEESEESDIQFPPKENVKLTEEQMENAYLLGVKLRNEIIKTSKKVMKKGKQNS